MFWFWSRFTKFDRFLIGGAAVILLLSTFLIVEDSWLFSLLSTSDKDLTRIGQVRSAVNDVRRRHNIAFSWLPLSDKTLVYQGDSIFTGDRSEAIVFTEKGEKISIAPNSLVVINAQTDSIRLDINYGSVLGQISKDKKLLIAGADGEITEVEGDDAVVKIDVGHDKNLVVNVLEGQVEVTSQDGTRTLGPQQQASIAEGGAIVDPSDVRIELLSPVADRVLKPDEGRDVVLTWRSSYNFTEYNIDIASDPDFKNIIVHDKTPRALYRPPTMPTNERLFWRVTAALKAGQTLTKSPTSAFTIAQDTPSNIVFPRDGARLTFEDQAGEDGQKLMVVMRWVPRSISVKWEVQLASSPDFAKDLQIFEARDTSANLGMLYEGSYHARVRAKDWPDAQWSETQSFFVTRRPAAVLRPPQVVSANDTFLLSTKTAGVTAQELAAAAPEKLTQYVEAIPELVWSPIQGAISYEIEIAAAREFTHPVVRTDVPDPRYGWESVKLGKFFWRIRSVSAGNRRGPFTTPQPLTVKLAPPRNLTSERVVKEEDSLVKMETPPAPFLLQWTPTLFTSKYELEFDKVPDFTKPLRLYTPYPFKKVQTGQAGTFHWRVRAVDNANKPITDWTTPFKYEFVRVYVSPENSKELKALSPSDETLMLIGKGERMVNFRWTVPFKHGKYRFQMAGKEDFSQIKHDFLTEKDFFILRSPLPDGWYYWRLRVENDKFTSPWTPIYKFQIKTEQQSFNFARSEKIQEQEIQRLEALKARQIAEYEKKEKAEEAEIERAIEANLPVLESPTDLTGPDHFTAEFRPLPASLKTIESLPLEEQMKLVREQPILEWQPVTGATGYRVEFAEDDKFTKKVDTVTTQLPSLRWPNLRPGKFHWRVVATSPRHRASQPSDAALLEITVNRPRQSTPHALLLTSTTAEKQVFLKWSPVIFAKGYEVQWGGDKQFRKPSAATVTGPEYRLAVNKQGVYFWRVRPVGHGGQPLADWTPSRPLTLGFMPAVQAQGNSPVLIFPVDQGSIESPDDETPVIGFHWQSPPPIGAFVLEVAKDQAFSAVAVRNTTRNTSLLVPMPAHDGTYYWRLSISSQGRVLWKSPVKSFSLTTGLRQPAGH
jgi:hypothetical protein